MDKCFILGAFSFCLGPSHASLAPPSRRFAGEERGGDEKFSEPPVIFLRFFRVPGVGENKCRGKKRSAKSGERVNLSFFLMLVAYIRTE